MKAPVIALLSLGCIDLAQANKYKDRLKEQEEKRIVPHQAAHRVNAEYDSQWCIYEKIDAKEGTLNQMCVDHATDVRIGWELTQTSDDDDDITYWRLRLYPYAYGELDWKPFTNFNADKFKYYGEVNAVVDDFKMGVFGDLTFWWDWSAIDTSGEGTREICYAAGQLFEAITLTLTTQFYIYDCYKTIINNLLKPFDQLSNLFEWTKCDESDQIDAPLWEQVWYEGDEEDYWVGEDVDIDATEGCTGGLFANNPLAANIYDIAVSNLWTGYGTKKSGSKQK